MWFLEHESLFGGKRVWLRPGSQQLFGRTKSTDKDEGTSWKIDNKAVSRKHVMLKVHDVVEGNGTKLHTRSQVEITDLSCRQGTTIDEKTMLKSQKADDGSLKYERTILTGTDHKIRLAQGYPPFRIVWQPVVFTYASRESKESKVRSAQLHALDIKTTTDFVFDKTTHVVSQKRNLPKVLSGLVAGKYIVTSDFLDLVLQLAKASVDEADNYKPSKLEEDFDTWWPKEKDYIPPVGAEPVPRPQEMLLPDPTRSEVFSGLTFIFMVQSQYSSLLEPVAGGSGKGLFFEAKPGETTVQEYVDYVHSVAGRKKRSHADNGKMPIITVRLGTYPDGMEDWASNFVVGVDQALNQRSIMQNEFLDAILTKDRAVLQRPPSELVAAPSEEAPSQMAEQEPTQTSQPKAPTPKESNSPEPEETKKAIPRKRAIRAKTTSRFTGFDDYEPPPKRSKVEAAQMEDVQQCEPSIGRATQSRVIPSSQQESGEGSHIRTTIEKEEQLDTLFPAAAAIKRKRAATRAPSASVEPEAGGAVKSPKSKGKVALERLQRTQAKIDNRELNVREKLEQRVKEEDERHKADEDALREALDGIDIAEMRNLAVIEEMEIKPRANRESTRQTQDHSDRWNPEWNGRKNFKRFRRRGADRGVQGNKVIVTVEEAAAKKTFDTFYLSDNEAPSTFRSARSGDHQQEDDSASEPEPGFTKRAKNNRKEKRQNEVVVVEDSGPDDEELPVRRTQRSSGRTQRVDETQVVEATPEQGTARARKRSPAVASSAGQAASKRRKVRRDDDSDEEETGFRFKRRG